MLHISFLINDFSSALLSRLPLDGFSRGFHRSVPLWLQMNDLNLDFRIFEGRCHGNQLSFSEISFFRRNSKTTRGRHVVPGKENVGNFVFCRMAPSVMTSGNPGSQNCFRFVLLLGVRFAQKVRDRPSPFFSLALRPTDVDDSCETGSLVVNSFRIVEVLRI